MTRIHTLICAVSLMAATAAYGATNAVVTTPGTGGALTASHVACADDTSDVVNCGDTGATSPVIGTSAAAQTESLTFQSAAGQNRSIIFKSGTATRWQFNVLNTAESGSNVGSPLNVGAYSDAGAFLGNLYTAQRTSGPVGGGSPYYSTIAPGVFNISRAVTPNGISGNYFNWINTQPTTTLGSNPIATTNGSPNVVITWTGHGLGSTADWVNVNISGATAVGGLTLSGWYRAIAIAANTITVNAGSNAVATTTGGGSAVQITPDFSTAGLRLDFAPSDAGSNFSDGFVEYMHAEPTHYITVASGSNGPQYQGMFAAALSPSDNSQLNSWGLSAFELDTVNRGADEGYQLNIFGAPRPTIGMNSAPENLSQFTGNEGKNTTVAFLAPHNAHANSTGYWVKWYQGFACSPDALVSNTAAPSSHGGICLDAVGAYESLGANPFTTSSGLTTVTVTVNNSGTGSLINAHNTPVSVYIPTSVTVRGVTIAAGVYAVSNVTGTTFDITGVGAASSSGTGGGTTVSWVSFANDVPYSPAQWSGEFAHGLIATNAKFDDGYALNTTSGINAGVYSSGGTAGVSCAGALTGAAVVTNGIVTHC